MSAVEKIEFDPWGFTGLPQYGFRNYWYPVLASFQVRKKPRAVQILGEDVVLYRDGGKLFALQDRCAHRGAKLSMGKCLYPGSGTISCPYHGWTYKGDSGQCVAKLVEGPEAPIPPQAKVKTFPVQEFRGVIWIFVGDMDPVPLQEDLPTYLHDKDEWFSIWNWRTYKCDWRLLSDNLSHDQHAPFLHRTAPELKFKPIFPHATRNSTVTLDDGKSIGHSAAGGVTSAEYPGLGRFPPKEEWYRVMKPTGRAEEIDPVKSKAAVKYGIHHRHISMMPSINLIGRPSGEFFTCRWITPVDAQTTVLWNFNLFRKVGNFPRLRASVDWLTWRGWAHDWLFSDQDKWIVETMKPGRELLSRTDVGVVAWRRFAVQNARRPPQMTEAPRASPPQSVEERATAHNAQ